MELNFSKLTTKSGVSLWVLPISYSRTVAAGVLINAGTRDENWPKEAGIAHALEHMFLQGTKNFPTQRDLTSYIEEIGGAINAWTAKEMTFCYVQVPAFEKERAVRILSEQLRESLFLEEKVPVEMKNIVQEIRRRNDNPQRFIGQIANQFLYKNHPLSKDTLGTEESVLSFTRNDLISFKERYYNSSNFTFIIAGGITAEEALNLFESYFPERSELKPNLRAIDNIVDGEEKKLIKNKDIEQVHVYLSARISPAKEKETLYLDFFRTMIAGGMSFPLFQEVRDRRGLCYEIWANITKWSDIGSFVVYIGTDPKRYKEAIDTAIEVISKSAADEDLLTKVKNLKIGRLDLLYQNTRDIIDIAARDIAFVGEPRGYDQIVKEIKEVNIDNIKNVVDRYLKPEMLYTTMLVPNDFKE